MFYNASPFVSSACESVVKSNQLCGSIMLVDSESCAHGRVGREDARTETVPTLQQKGSATFYGVRSTRPGWINSSTKPSCLDIIQNIQIRPNWGNHCAIQRLSKRPVLDIFLSTNIMDAGLAIVLLYSDGCLRPLASISLVAQCDSERRRWASG